MSFKWTMRIAKGKCIQEHSPLQISPLDLVFKSFCLEVLVRNFTQIEVRLKGDTSMISE